MAVVYMKKLEEEPDDYFSKFSQLTNGINKQVNDWILDKVGTNNKILEVGCGPGVLSLQMAKKGNKVVAIDRNPQMVNKAQKSKKGDEDCSFFIGEAALYYPPDIEKYIKYKSFDSNPSKPGEIKISTMSNFTVNSMSLLSPLRKTEDSNRNLTYRDITSDANRYDFVVSTFMLSELRPFEQQIFLRRVWKTLKPQGELIISAEFVPNGLSKLGFYIKRLYYKKKLKRLKIGTTNPLKSFHNYFKSIGFKVTEKKEWSSGSVQVLQLEKFQSKLDGKSVNSQMSEQSGYYTPNPLSYKGIGAFYRKMRCILTGQVDHIGIEPGFYKVGNPDRSSPIIVTANYDYSYIHVRQKIDGINAWLLCVDSDGVNVWCSARGNNFGNKQLFEAVEATDISEFSDIKTLILPQLSAGGVSMLELHKYKKEFSYYIKYGPVWAEDLPQYLDEIPKEKPDHMKLAKYTISHRFRAGITHITFLLRKIFVKPTLLILLGLFGLLAFGEINLLKIVPQIWLGIIITNLTIALIFPIVNFTRKFIYKGIIFGVINVFILEIITWQLYRSTPFMLLNSVMFFWIAFFSTMSFSGNTFSTSPTEIMGEYELFTKINRVLLYLGLLLSTIGVILLILSLI